MIWASDCWRRNRPISVTRQCQKKQLVLVRRECQLLDYVGRGLVLYVAINSRPATVHVPRSLYVQIYFVWQTTALCVTTILVVPVVVTMSLVLNWLFINLAPPKKLNIRRINISSQGLKLQLNIEMFWWWASHTRVKRQPTRTATWEKTPKKHTEE